MSEKRRDNKGRILKTWREPTKRRKIPMYKYIDSIWENRNLFPRGNLWLQTEYQQESVIVSHLEKENRRVARRHSMMV